jgi:HNH endonuclease
MNLPFNPQPKVKKRHSKKPSMATRKKFPKHVVEEAIELWERLCANCRSKPPDDPHHIRFKSDDGKGVLTNLLPVCRKCHEKIHREPELAQYWKDWAKKEHGFEYWMDEWDREAKKYEKAMGN